MNKPYVSYLLHKHKKLLFIEFAVFVGLIALLNVTGSNLFGILIYSGGFGYEQSYLLHTVMKYYLVFNAIVIPIYLNYKLYHQNGNDLYGSLPIQKEKKLFSEMVFGFVLVSVPALIVVIISCFTGFMSDYLILQLSIQYLIVFALLYVVNFFILIKSNTTFDGILLIIVALIIFWQFPYILQRFAADNTIGNVDYSYFTYEGGQGNVIFYMTCFLSPVFMLTQIFSISGFAGVDLNGLIILGFYLLLTIGVTLFTLISYKNKKIEQYGGKTTSRAAYPLLISLLCGMFCMTFFTSGASTPGILIGILVVFVIYLCFFFVAQRKVQVKSIYIVWFVLILSSVYFARLICVSTEGFYSVLKDYDSIEVNNVEIATSIGDTYIVYSVSDLNDDKWASLELDLTNLQNEMNQNYITNNRWWPEKKSSQECWVHITYIQQEKEMYSSKSYSYDIKEKYIEKVEQLLARYGFSEKDESW